jgi:hypothetical protein
MHHLEYRLQETRMRLLTLENEQACERVEQLQQQQQKQKRPVSPVREPLHIVLNNTNNRTVVPMHKPLVEAKKPEIPPKREVVEEKKQQEAVTVSFNCNNHDEDEPVYDSDRETS